MNYQSQFQNIKQQLGNIDIQFDQLIGQAQNMTSSNSYSIAIQILNIGINVLNLGNLLSNMENDTFSYALQIENIGMQIQNIGNQIKNKNNMNNMNNMNDMNNIDIIEIFFEYDGFVRKIKCLYDELVSSIINRYCKNNNLNQDSLSFLFNRKTLSNDLAASEIGLGNLSTIEVEDKFNLNFNKF